MYLIQAVLSYGKLLKRASRVILLRGIGSKKAMVYGVSYKHKRVIIDARRSALTQFSPVWVSNSPVSGRFYHYDSKRDAIKAVDRLRKGLMP